MLKIVIINIFCSIIACYSLTSNAQEQILTCNLDSGEKVTTVFGSEPRLATAFYLNNKPYIKLDYKKFQHMSENAQRLVFFHECGHHKLNHLLHFKETGGSLQIEREADCYAMYQMIQHYGYSAANSAISEMMLPNEPRRQALYNCHVTLLNEKKYSFPFINQ